MEFIDLKTQYKTLQENIKGRITRMLEHGSYIMGPEVAELEVKLARFTGARYCISCANGTDALLMVLLAKGIGPGDAVFTTPFTFIATAEVISLLGATPVFVDIDPATFNIDASALESAVIDLAAGCKPTADFPEGLKPKAVIPVDLFGLPADYDAINKVAKRHGLFVLEDGAQSMGAVYRGRKAGSLAEAATTSFFPAKPLGCYGDGGAIFTDDKELAETLGSIRVHGKGSDKYDNVRIGMNSRLDTLQAAILLAKLEIFEAEVAKRQQVAMRYSEALRGTIVVPHVPEGSASAWAQYSVLSPRKLAIMDALKKAGIPSMVYYPKPLHLQTAFAFLGYRPGEMPVSEKTAEEIFSLPMHPYLESREQAMVVEVIQRVVDPN